MRLDHTIAKRFTSDELAALATDLDVEAHDPGPAPADLATALAAQGRAADLLAALLREWFFVELFRVCAESLASEHASRLLAMQTAERNITDRLAELNTVYRQQRQEAITSELLDVVAGFEALAGSRSAQG